MFPFDVSWFGLRLDAGSCLAVSGRNLDAYRLSVPLPGTRPGPGLWSGAGPGAVLVSPWLGDLVLRDPGFAVAGSLRSDPAAGSVAGAVPLAGRSLFDAVRIGLLAAAEGSLDPSVQDPVDHFHCVVGRHEPPVALFPLSPIAGPTVPFPVCSSHATGQWISKSAVCLGVPSARVAILWMIHEVCSPLSKIVSSLRLSSRASSSRSSALSATMWPATHPGVRQLIDSDPNVPLVVALGRLVNRVSCSRQQRPLPLCQPCPRSLVHAGSSPCPVPGPVRCRTSVFRVGSSWDAFCSTRLSALFGFPLLQANRKTLEGRQHPDRDAQFRRIARRVRAFQRLGQPVASIDTKKKELVGRYRNGGREWRPKGQPEAVKVHDFIDLELGKAIPYGVYDLTANTGWVSVGVDHDTAEFAVETVRRWWRQMGRHAYPAARRLLLTADGGGSNSSRSRLWKFELQKLADALGLRISVCHFPPGTSKWNKIEHRMFCHITENWRGRPLVSHEVVVNVIGATTTQGGLAIQSELDEASYPTGRGVTDEEMDRLYIKRDTFHGDWNYSLLPRSA